VTGTTTPRPRPTDLGSAVDTAAGILGPIATRSHPLAPLTTYRVGGPAALFVRACTLADLASGLNSGTIVFELAKLGALSRAALVVEDRYSALLKVAHAPAGFLPDLLARVQVRYPEIPIVFAETRPLAEEWTFRWLGAALAASQATDDEDDVP